MKYLLKITLILGAAALSYSASAQVMEQENTGDESGIHERPAIENLIEVWGGNPLTPTLSSMNGLISTGVSTDIKQRTDDSTSSSSVILSVADTNEDDKKDDTGNPPRELELLEKRDIIYQDRNMVLYPNPAQYEINVSLKESDIQKIEIYNMAGSLVYRCTNGATAYQNVRIDLNSMARGVYMMHVTALNSVSTKKFALR